MHEPVLITDLDLKVTLRRPGHDTVRRSFKGWGELNSWLVDTAKKRDYPYGSVLTVEDWTGRDRFIVKGGAAGAPTIVKLSSAVVGLPSNPAFGPADPKITPQ